MMRRTAMIALLALSTSADVAFAQVVRGRVTDSSSGAPVAGALVSLLGDVSDSTIVSLLTSESGEYGIRAAIPGSYRIAVKRIGVRRFVSEVFTLADGETRIVDVRIDPIAQELPQVTVSGMCAARPREIARISSLWDEARTALEATEISLRDRLMQARITRYVAELEPSNLQVLFDWRSDAEVMVEQPFTSPSGDSLSALGYWRVLPGDSVEFLAPDARALSSDAFLRDHCFTLTGAPRGRPGLVGLGFSPTRDRHQNDIAGTVWIDARSYELRFIEFRYTGLRADLPHANRVGGEVHFARLSSGAWIVDRWFIRMPQVQDMPPPVGTLRRLREEGGTVTVGGMTTSRPMASVAGIFRDSANRPVADAMIRAIGSHRQTRTGLDGGYRLDSLPIGGMSIVAHTGGYDAFALLAGSKRVELQAGRTALADFRAPNAAALRSVACPPNAQFAQQPGQGALRVLLVDSATVAPMPGVQFLVSWQDPLTRYTTEEKEKSRTAITDNRGTATFCSLPAGVELELQLFGTDAARSPITTITLPRTGIVGRVITGKISR